MLMLRVCVCHLFVLSVQVLRGNIRVMCRVRPVQQKSPSGGAKGSPGSSCISVPLEGLLCVNDVASARQREFEFDACFGPEATQQQVSRGRRACAAQQDGRMHGHSPPVLPSTAASGSVT